MNDAQKAAGVQPLSGNSRKASSPKAGSTAAAKDIRHKSAPTLVQSRGEPSKLPTRARLPRRRSLPPLIGVTARKGRPPARPTGSAPPSLPVASPPAAGTATASTPARNRHDPTAGARPRTSPQSAERDTLPARMLNEFVYCPRLFYYELVEGVFVDNADTRRGAALHQRVDSGNGALPAVPNAEATRRQQDQPPAPAPHPAVSPDQAEPATPETIHSRSVQMGSERLGVVAKMDLVEARVMHANAAEADLFTALEVCPVDYKAGAPRQGAEANELWDTDKMQLGLQALILRDNGYTCSEGLIYYRATRQRVRLPITPELEQWVLAQIAAARQVLAGPIPAPLVHSPKCVRCSLAPVCLPDETRMLAPAPVAPHLQDRARPPAPPSSQPTSPAPAARSIRRLIAARDDTRALYLNTPGLRVGCQAEVLTVKDKDKLVEAVRTRDVSHVALFGNIQISTQAIHLLCEQEVPVTYFSMGGWFYGLTRGHTLKNIFLRMEQFRRAGDAATCLALARKFVQGKIRNQRTLLMRNHLEPPAEAVGKLKRAAADALNARSLEQLLGIEGAAASLYFQHFSGMIKAEDDLPAMGESVENTQRRSFPFNFTQRNRRPPTDPVNALLSLVYSLLAKDCTLAALAVGFDPYLGFFHQPRFGRPALGLDLMEEFRPLVAESTVLSCINNRIITEKDFVQAGQAVNLSAPGRKRVFQTYEQRMSALLTHPLFDYKVSYRRALELQTRLLAKTLTGEIAEYLPLLTR